jgi:hypothetical protein
MSVFAKRNCKESFTEKPVKILKSRKMNNTGTVTDLWKTNLLSIIIKLNPERSVNHLQRKTKVMIMKRTMQLALTNQKA